MAKSGKAEAEFDPTEGGGESTFESGDTSVMVDLSNVEAATFEVVPKGVYEAVIEECTFQHSQNSGQPMWAMRHNITDGPSEGRKIFDNVSFSPKAMPFSKKTLAVIAPELLSGPFDPEQEAPKMEGKKVKFRTTLKKWEGRDQTRIVEYLTVEEAFLGG